MGVARRGQFSFLLLPDPPPTPTSHVPCTTSDDPLTRQHYKTNTWVAGYNPLNEPTDSEHTRLLTYYVRLEKAIRAVDPDHMLFLDGNTFGADMSRFSADKRHPLPNTVYACHDYSRYGFPNPPEPWAGTQAQVEYQERTFARKVEYMKAVGGPIWSEWRPSHTRTIPPRSLGFGWPETGDGEGDEQRHGDVGQS